MPQCSWVLQRRDGSSRPWTQSPRTPKRSLPPVLGGREVLCRVWTRRGRLNRGVVMRRWLRVRPVADRDPETCDPMDRLAALRAVEHELTEITLESGLGLQELEPQHLRVDGEGMRSVQAGIESLVGEGIRGGRLFALRDRTARRRTS